MSGVYNNNLHIVNSFPVPALSVADGPITIETCVHQPWSWRGAVHIFTLISFLIHLWKTEGVRKIIASNYLFAALFIYLFRGKYFFCQSVANILCIKWYLKAFYYFQEEDLNLFFFSLCQKLSERGKYFFSGQETKKAVTEWIKFPICKVFCLGILFSFSFLTD